MEDLWSGEGKIKNRKWSNIPWALTSQVRSSADTLGPWWPWALYSSSPPKCSSLLPPPPLTSGARTVYQVLALYTNYPTKSTQQPRGGTVTHVIQIHRKCILHHPKIYVHWYACPSPRGLPFPTFISFGKGHCSGNKIPGFFHSSPATDGRVIPDKPISLYNMVQARNSQLGCTLESPGVLLKVLMAGPHPLETAIQLAWVQSACCGRLKWP